MKRKYRNILSLVYNEPWAITPERMETVAEIINLRLDGVQLSRDEIESRIAAAQFGRPVSPAVAPTGSKIAVLNLSGLISHRVNAMSDISGGTSTELFGKAFDKALADPQVSSIVLNVDSGGGSVAGVPELSDKIYNARGQKPIVAIANADMGSAAYWIASAADKIYATPSGSAGSLGVITVHTDGSAADAKKGLKRTIIKSSTYKAEGNPHEPLSAESQSAIQAKVNTIHGTFIAAVARNRGVSASKVEADFGQGRMLLAKDALAVGLIDKIATFDALISELGAGGSAGGGSVSLAAVAAPPSPTALAVPALSTETKTMNPQILTAMIRANLCGADVTAEHAQLILAGFFAAKGQSVPTDPAAVVSALAPAVPAPTPTATPAAASVPAVHAPLAAAPAPAAAGMSVADLVAMVSISPLSADEKLALQNELIPQAASLSVAAITGRINQAAASKSKPVGAGLEVSVTADSRDKFMAAARDAVLCHGWGGNLPKEIYDRRTGNNVDWKPHSRVNYGMASPMKLAEQCLVMAGVPYHVVAGLPAMHIAQLIMGKSPADLGLQIGASDGAWNTSGLFSNLMLDAQNIMLRRSYVETNTTFQAWCKQGESVRDFKTVNKIIGGELPDPRVIPEDGEFEETTISDGKETYKVVVWGERFSITWQTLVNDLMSAFTEIPMKQGAAMRRKQNKLAYGIINDNSALQNDSIALFHASHNNLLTGVAAPSVANFNTMYVKLAQQTGLNSATILGLEPKFVLAPPALRGSVLQVLGSTADPAATNSGVKNIWENALTPVFDAQLGASATNGSDVAYYFATDPNVCDTVEYAYLQGLESPALDQQMSFDRLAIAYRIYLAFAVKALDFRGLVKQQGS